LALQNVVDRLERQLVKDAVGGDIESFGKLCRRYYSAMVAIGYSILADHQLAEDVAQESFARALVNLRRLKDKKRFAPWLAAICRNVSKDMLATKTREISIDGLSEAANDDSDNESSRAVHQAIEQLPESAKELVVLRYYDGLSYEQIGSVLGISKATINGRLTRAKRKMAKYLKRNGFLENRL
jgi:RNA polymerase sigma-70 factor (ECF subfamily)